MPTSAGDQTDSKRIGSPPNVSKRAPSGTSRIASRPRSRTVSAAVGVGTDAALGAARGSSEGPGVGVMRSGVDDGAADGADDGMGVSDEVAPECSVLAGTEQPATRPTASTQAPKVRCTADPPIVRARPGTLNVRLARPHQHLRRCTAATVAKRRVNDGPIWPSEGGLACDRQETSQRFLPVGGSPRPAGRKARRVLWVWQGAPRTCRTSAPVPLDIVRTGVGRLPRSALRLPGRDPVRELDSPFG
jgi:hypothetical protein